MAKKTKSSVKKTKKKSGTKTRSSSSKNLLDRQLLSKIDKVLSIEKQILNKEISIEKKEESIERIEGDIESKEERIRSMDISEIAISKDEMKEIKKVEALEQKGISEIEKLERLEKEIKTEVSQHPLKKITYHDFVKSIIGAFFGIVGHFAFIYGTHIAENISYLRATMLYLISFAIAVGFIYFSGFRKVKEYHAWKIIPLRVITIYLVSLTVVTVVLFVFGYADLSHGVGKIYKDVGAISILAILGACAADLVGKE